MDLRPAYVIGGLRTPFAKSFATYRELTNQDLMTACLKALVKKYGLENKNLGDVAIGAIIKNSLDWNLARECVQGSGLGPYTPAYGLQRACGTGLDACSQIALKLACRQINTGIGGGVDTNSDVPMLLSRTFTQKFMHVRNSKSWKEKLEKLLAFRPSDLKIEYPSIIEPRTGLSMGQHCELMVKEWRISRAEQDELALQSHHNAAKAYEEGFYDDLVIEMAGIKRDTIVRGDTSMDKLSKLKPAFDKSEAGTLTAGNSSPFTDGAAAVLLASEDDVRRYAWTPQARFVDSQVAAVDYVHGDGLLMAPTIAVSQLLERNGLTLQDFDFYEIHEAFTGQVLCTLKAWESADYCKRILKRDQSMGKIDRAKLNVKGGSVALGHPFAATGARIVATLAKLLFESKKRRGLISICTAGGMGVAAILEAV